MHKVCIRRSHYDAITVYQNHFYAAVGVLQRPCVDAAPTAGLRRSMAVLLVGYYTWLSLNTNNGVKGMETANVGWDKTKI